MLCSGRLRGPGAFGWSGRVAILFYWVDGLCLLALLVAAMFLRGMAMAKNDFVGGKTVISVGQQRLPQPVVFVGRKIAARQCRGDDRRRIQQGLKAVQSGADVAQCVTVGLQLVPGVTA